MREKGEAMAMASDMTPHIDWRLCSTPSACPVRPRRRPRASTRVARSTSANLNLFCQVGLARACSANHLASTLPSGNSIPGPVDLFSVVGSRSGAHIF